MEKSPPQFPPVKDADPEGLIAVGGDLSIDTLLMAYKSGIFPWPLGEKYPMTWFSPDPRAILILDEYKPSKSLIKLAKNTHLTIKENTVIDEVLLGCRTCHRSSTGGTWVTKKLIQGYKDFFDAGYCYTVECFDGTELVGGLFGVKIGKMVTAESMFYKKPNASKLCIYHLVCKLKETADIKWIDLQVLNPFTKNIGATEIRREQFIELVKIAVNETL